MSENNLRDPAGREPEAKHRLNMMIAVLVIVSVIVVGAFIAYDMNNDFGSQPRTPSAELVSSGSWSGKVFTIARMEGEVHWSDATIFMYNSTDFAQWHPTTEELWQGPYSEHDLGERPFGPGLVYCSVTDLEGNGFLDRGDFFTLIWLSDDVYTAGLSVGILHETYGERLCEVLF